MLAAVIVLAAIGYAAIPSSTFASLTWTFEDCVINEMRGQSSSIEPTARKACARQFSLRQLTGTYR